MGSDCTGTMPRWLLWLEGTGHRTCLAVQQQRFGLQRFDSHADSLNLEGPGLRFGAPLERRHL